jgi:hypothetical protein
MTGHRPRPQAPADGTQLTPAILVAVVASLSEADRALAAGADMIDASGLTEQDAAALRGGHPGLRLWHGSPAAADTDHAGTPAAIVATAAVLAWLGTPAIRTRHVLPVRRAIDMTCSIAGTRLPALTTRGLA